MQTLILWSLIADPNGGCFQKDVKPVVKKPDRDALVAAGLVASAKRGRGLWLEVTDKGWDWAGEHLDAALPKGSTAGCAILSAWLKRLAAFLAAKDFALADVIGAQAAAKPASQPRPDPRERVRAAYLEATGGRLNQRVFLNVVREKLADVDRAALDEALRALHGENGAHLSGSDNPPEITPTIRAASLDFKGETMVALWITR
jgi:hypothetical protein